MPGTPVAPELPGSFIGFPALAFTLGVTLLTGLVFGMAPAAAAVGIGIQDALKSASQTHTGQGAARLRQLLVVAELALSLVLLIGAGLLFKSFAGLLRTPLGFSAQNLLTLRVNLAGSRYTTWTNQAHFYDEVLERVTQLPMVRAAAVSTDLPSSGERPFQQISFQVEGRSPLPAAQRPQSSVTVVNRDFFRTPGHSHPEGTHLRVRG